MKFFWHVILKHHMQFHMNATNRSSLLCRNDVATSFWRNDNVIITSCVHWAVAIQSYVVATADDILTLKRLGHFKKKM